MTHSVTEALQALKNLGTVAEMQAAADRGLAPASRPKVNSHIHLPPNFSAFVSVQQAVDLAAEQHVGVVGVSNYYDYDVYGDFVTRARAKKIFPLFGLEIIALLDDLVKAGVKLNDPGNPGKLYICGKGITRIAPFSPEALRLLNIIREADSARMAKIVRKLDEVFAQRGLAVNMSEAKVIDMVQRRHGCPRESVYIQERHVCQAFQEAAFAAVPAEKRLDVFTKLLGAAPKNINDPVAVQNDIRAHLLKAGKAAYVQETFVNMEQAYRLILELGGIPAYPVLADGANPICGFEDPVEKLIETIRAKGLFMAEFIPIRNTPQVLSKYVKAIRAAGLAVTAGTEHNTLDLLPIEPTCVKGAAVPEDVREIFWEGACVVAAHQFLTLNGECGFVDGNGRRNAKYGGDEHRLAAFRKLGAAVMAKYGI